MAIPMFNWLLVLVLTACGGHFNGVRGDGGRESDRVTGLPGQPAVGFGQYAGYVNLRPDEEKALFYWFFEAEGGVSDNPLLLWLNGGPGCSSIAYGAAQELGPFLVRNNGSSLVFNNYAWNKVANLLFLESPVGVGFSYTNNSDDLKRLGDKITAEDSHTFLLNWFQRFPEFKSHDFYITGESYAVINDATDQVGMVEYAWSHTIISDELYDSINKECDFNNDTTTPACNSVIKAFFEAFSDIDIYSIFTPVCLSSLGNSSMKKKKLIASPKPFSQHDMWHRLPSGYDPCTDSYVTIYFNREDVQKALHANVTKLSYPYSSCSNVIEKWNDSVSTVLPIIRKLIDAGLRIWIYSGDTDARVPFTSTKMSLNVMKLKVKGEWRTWFNKAQVGGWTEDYEGGLTYATVRGAGHQVPVLAPSQSLSLVSHFLSGDPLPKSRF
ncbi:Serine carboxypeptidase-like 35 [Acorus calamus]|uniref:Serine carboxypeptidase-like 35 n=1 Tax=Acorus calamus TaxID=4465 RepID=A0AAV9FAF9_ACOCL|nr:Serine carboxypeptidase-like 35 [Acorus calamus]